eukprot:4437779-Karenia_brevis.AAC.1
MASGTLCAAEVRSIAPHVMCKIEKQKAPRTYEPLWDLYGPSDWPSHDTISRMKKAIAAGTL